MKTLILLAGFLFVAILSAIRKMKGKRELELPCETRSTNALLPRRAGR